MASTRTESPITLAPKPGFLIGPIPGGSLHGTPRPPLENTGTDYVAIYESLEYSFRWLCENPDPALVGDLYVDGTPLFEEFTTTFADFKAKGYSCADDNFRLISVDLVSTSPANISLRVVSERDDDKVVAATGRVVDRVPLGSPKTKIMVLQRGGDARWRISQSAPAGDPGVIQE